MDYKVDYLKLRVRLKIMWKEVIEKGLVSLHLNKEDAVW